MTTTATMETGDDLVLQCNDNSNFTLHATGIWPAVCVDVVNLGLVWTEFQGNRKLVRKVKLVFETEAVGDDGKRGIVTKNFTASLHPKAKLAEFLGKWRGRPVVPGENIDLKKVLGASCTLVLSHQQSMAGRTYVSIDAVSKPTKRVMPSGTYDAAAMRQRIAEWAAKEASATPGNLNGGQRSEARGQTTASRPLPPPPMVPTAPANLPTKSEAAPAPYPEFNEEMGF